MNSSDMPSEKYSLAGSPLELTIGSTAIDFSGNGGACVVLDAGEIICRSAARIASEHERGDSIQTLLRCAGFSRLALAAAC